MRRGGSSPAHPWLLLRPRSARAAVRAAGRSRCRAEAERCHPPGSRKRDKARPLCPPTCHTHPETADQTAQEPPELGRGLTTSPVSGAAGGPRDARSGPRPVGVTPEVPGLLSLPMGTTAAPWMRPFGARCLCGGRGGPRLRGQEGLCSRDLRPRSAHFRRTPHPGLPRVLVGTRRGPGPLRGQTPPPERLNSYLKTVMDKR